MRFVWAVAAFVLATVLIGAGIAQRTIFLGPSSDQVSVKVDEPAPFVLLDGDVLRERPGAQTLLVRGDGEIFAAYGRTADMEAWLADSDYNHVSVAKNGKLDVELVSASTADADSGDGDATPAPTETPADGAEQATAARNPAGSDLWLDSFSEKDSLIADNMQLPDGMSMLIAYDGTKDAPTDISVSWPLDNSTPLTGPLVTSGVVVLFIGLILYVLGIRHQRRGRGPRRKGPGPLPVTEPIDLAELPAADRAAIEEKPDAAAERDEAPESEAGESTKPSKAEMRGARPSRRRWVIALPALAVTAVLATGCTADSWPQLGSSSPTPTPTPTVIAPDNQKPPAVTESQAKRIIEQISSTLEKADGAMDIELAKTRLDGAALAARTTDYALRTAIPESPVPAAIPTDDVEVVLPEATDRWPRTVLLLTKSTGDETAPPVILTMTQQDPWSNYKITDIAEMLADTKVPEVVAPWLGTSLVPADSAFLSIAPGKLAETFADVVDANEQSPSYGSYDDVALAYAKSIRDSRQAIVDNLAANNAATTSQTSFDIVPSDSAPVSMTTLDSGAIVAVTLIEAETVTPTSSEAVIRFENNPEAKALTGVTESAKGITTKYEFQLFFAVPAQGSTEQIHLLAARQNLLSVEVIK
ncbi:glycosyl transferase [Microbacterium sp. ZW T6_19]|uniref:glycosyl transferase n=1 Tax=Microbacterium sp. ZW T6_19 TaxID=3378082 RepID=UPI0038537AD1